MPTIKPSCNPGKNKYFHRRFTVENVLHTAVLSKQYEYDH